MRSDGKRTARTARTDRPQQGGLLNGPSIRWSCAEVSDNLVSVSPKAVAGGVFQV